MWSPKYINSLTFASKLFSNFSEEFMATLSGLKEIKEDVEHRLGSVINLKKFHES